MLMSVLQCDVIVNACKGNFEMSSDALWAAVIQKFASEPQSSYSDISENIQQSQGFSLSCKVVMSGCCMAGDSTSIHDVSKPQRILYHSPSLLFCMSFMSG